MIKVKCTYKGERSIGEGNLAYEAGFAEVVEKDKQPTFTFTISTTNEDALRDYRTHAEYTLVPANTPSLQPTPTK